jgi:hypothetical protein
LGKILFLSKPYLLIALPAKIFFMIKKWLAAPRKKREEGTFVATRTQAYSARRRAVLGFLAAVAIFGWTYVFFGSGVLDVQTLQIEGLTTQDRGEVARGVWQAIEMQPSFPGQQKNLLLLDVDALSVRLKNELYMENVAVEKFYPNILRLKLEEKQSSVIIAANNEFYLIDRHGIGSARIADEEQGQILSRISQPSPTAKTDTPILTINRGVFFAVGEPFVPEATVQGWLGAFQELSKAGFGYRRAILEHPTTTKLVLDLYEPYDAYFDLLTPVESQIEAFYAFTKMKPADADIRSYIDVRVPGRVYYK